MWKRFRSGPKPEPELRLLMVCSGNICRSPTAEGVLRAKLTAAGLQGRVEVDSAGTHGFHVSEAPDPRARRHAQQRGYDLSRLRARRVQPADFDRFDLMLAMDDGHVDWLRSAAPDGCRAQVQLLLAHARNAGSERQVPDPYYGADSGFERVLDLIEDACDGLVAAIQQGSLSRQGTS